MLTTDAIPAGDYEVKAAVNESWDENYGADGEAGGANIPLPLAEDTTVTFYYDHKTHWITDSVNSVIATAIGSFQSALGCAEDNDAACLRTWLQDEDGNGIYSLTTTAIPAGDYDLRVALNQDGSVSYGKGGQTDGDPVSFSVPEDGFEVTFGYSPSRNLVTARVEDPNVVEPTPAPTAVAAFAGIVTAPGSYQSEIGADDRAIVPGILKSQAGIVAVGEGGVALDGTGLQIPGVLDDLYTYDGALGVTYDGDVPMLALWAPTAQRVRLELFDDAQAATESETIPMTLDRTTGVWSVTGQADWTGKYYLYNVRVYAPSTQSLVTNTVTDPYSFSLSMNSARSQIVNLDDPLLQPAGWAEVAKPPLDAPEDIVLYELHVRDFSISDMTVPEDLRGTFMAFTETESDGMKHLRALAEAGLTHIHLLPAFDIATINENGDERQEPDSAELAALPPDSEEQQAILQPLRDLDGFNWGYDPLHYTVPEGSYSTDPNGTARIVEFREMVQALNANGLRVVMDVVYNHTNSSGQGDRSVLDRIVPGYYHRLNDSGLVATSTCCANTATEHAMMEKLMIDSVLIWATHYKVDGFRFDLMGHHMRANMEKLRAALDALTVENGGVDGKSIYVYGEGWDFGEVQGGARGTNATQLNMGGTGIGTFNDRLRDAVRGGSPFGDRVFQGFISGLSLYANGLTGGTEDEQRARLLLFKDQIRVGLAGNLRDYELTNAAGEAVTGADILYNGSPSGYTLDPQEHIVYISAHDNETLWDIIVYKQLPDMTVSDRVRVQNLGYSIVLLSQGVPFIHAGDEMLRSKSMDRNSYNSGDWFNRLDFTYQSNNWGAGLPPSGDNQDNWLTIQPLLAQAALKPSPEDILSGVAHVQEFLQIRKGSPLFRLQTAEDIAVRVTFPNSGPEQIPGLIVMVIADDGDLDDLDPNAERIVVLFNAGRDAQTFTDETLAGLGLELHPALAGSADTVVQTAVFDADNGTFTVPGLTAAVFVLGE